MTNVTYDRDRVSTSDALSPPRFSGLDIALGVLLLIMVWGPMSAAAFLHPMGTQFEVASQR
jgi:hypothetical protein